MRLPIPGPVRAVLFAGAAISIMGFDGIGSTANSNSIALPVARFQIQCQSNLFTIDADHADVASVLRSLMSQAHRQFAPDYTVVGQVNLTLTRQPLNTVLNAICQQTFLRYTVDKTTGITTFQRDDEATKAAFARLKTLNAQLRQQLRDMGLEVPADTWGVGVAGNAQGGAYGRGGGFGGGGYGYPFISGNINRNTQTGATYLYSNPLPDPANSIQNGVSQDAFQSQSTVNNGAQTHGRTYQQHPSLDVGQSNSAGNSAVHGKAADVSPKEAPSAAGAFQNDGARRQSTNISRSGYPTLNYRYQNLPVLTPMTQNTIDFANQGYQTFLNQNNLVSMRIPQTQPIPVADALQSLGRQVNVPILIDPDLPTDLKFSVWGYIPPRPLPEALNILAPYARLEWRWIGGNIFITPTPDFQVNFGESNALYAPYSLAIPAQSGSKDQRKAAAGPGAAGAPAGSAGGTSQQAPSSPPPGAPSNPNTNDKKK